MKTWYRAFYGSWRNDDEVHYIDGTFDKKQMFDKAQEIANEVKRTVCVQAEKGMQLKFYHVKPE